MYVQIEKEKGIQWIQHSIKSPVKYVLVIKITAWLVQTENCVESNLKYNKLTGADHVMDAKGNR